jgi:hypothetical protein
VGYQIFKTHIGADTSKVGIHRLGEVALVKRRAALLAQQLQRVGKIWIAKDVTRPRGCAVGEPNGGGVLELLDERFLLLKRSKVAPKVIGNDRRNRESPLGRSAPSAPDTSDIGSLPNRSWAGEPAVHGPRHGHR